MIKDKISVIMPTYNAELYLRQAVESILNQTYADFEFIIIDDGSTDRTEEIIKSYPDSRILYLKNKQNLGIVKTLNIGLMAARGEFIALMNADDISSSERLEKQYKFLQRKKDVSLVGSSAEYINQEGGLLKNEIKSSNYNLIKWQMLFDFSFINGSIFFRSEILKNLIGYKEIEGDCVEDYEFLLRVCEKYQVSNIKDKLYRYRVYGSSVSSLKKERIIENARKLSYNNLKRYVDLSITDIRNFHKAIAGELNDKLKLAIVWRLHRQVFLKFIANNNLSSWEIMLIFKDYLRVCLIILRKNENSGNQFIKMAIRPVYFLIKFIRNLFQQLRY